MPLPSSQMNYEADMHANDNMPWWGFALCVLEALMMGAVFAHFGLLR